MFGDTYETESVKHKAPRFLRLIRSNIKITAEFCGACSAVSNYNMGEITDKCPKCGNYTVGKMEETASQMVSREAVNGVYGGVCTYIGHLFGGPITALIVSTVLKTITSGEKKKVTESVTNQFDGDGRCVFACPRCGNSWSIIVHGDEDTTPDEVLENQRLEKLRKCIKSMTTNIILFIIALALTVMCFHYCLTNESYHTEIQDNFLFGKQEVHITNWTWLFSFLGCIVFGIGVLVHFFGSLNYINKKAKLSKMNVTEFRHSSYRDK